MSPIFLQFIVSQTIEIYFLNFTFKEAVYQITYQYPQHFEFNSRFLMTIIEHVHTGIYGTFLCNSYYEKYLANVTRETISLWSFINKNVHLFRNIYYDQEKSMKQDLLIPSCSEANLVVWKDYYFKWSKYLIKVIIPSGVT